MWAAASDRTAAPRMGTTGRRAGQLPGSSPWASPRQGRGRRSRRALTRRAGTARRRARASRKGVPERRAGDPSGICYRRTVPGRWRRVISSGRRGGGWGKPPSRPSMLGGRNPLSDEERKEERARDEGDEGPQGASLERIYRSHRPSVLSFFRRSLRSDRDVEDLTQDTFLRAQGSRQPRRPPSPGRVPPPDRPQPPQGPVPPGKGPHLLGPRRRRGRRPPRPHGHPGGDHARPARAASPLPGPDGPPQRTRQAVSILHKFHHLTYRQVAAVMGTSPKTVEKQIASGIATCRTAVRGRADAPGAEIRPFPAAGLRSGSGAAGRGKP